MPATLSIPEILIRSKRIRVSPFAGMIRSENRFPLFRIMFYDCGGVKPEAL